MSRIDRPTDDGADAGSPEDIEAVRVFDAYLAELQAGRQADSDRLLAEHPVLADRLRAFLNVTHLVNGVASDPVPVLGDFRILREIGRGGMGIVYEAEQVSRGRRVALKVLTSAAALDPRQLRRFQVEIQVAQLLRHPHIVPIAAFGCERGVHYYAMQYIEGRDLAAVIAGLRQSGGGKVTGGADSKAIPADVGPVDSDVLAAEPSLIAPDRPDGSASPRDQAFFRKAARWGLQAAEALHHAHKEGVLHRDIKPSNLLVDVRGNLWITDFGLAQVQDEDGVTRTGDLLGTLRYMSPEQALAKRVAVDDRTDVYSLGATLYELLTLEPAFGGSDRQELLHRIAFEEPRPPRRIDPAISWDLETIVLKAMAKDLAGRYASAQGLAADLRRFLEDSPIQARRPTPLERAEKWARRHKAPVATSFAILVAAVILLVSSIFSIEKARGRAVVAELEAQARERESQRESLLQQHQRLLNTLHHHGWSDEAWDLIRRSTRLGVGIGADFYRVQGNAVATLSGLDARPVKQFAGFGAESVAFDRQGQSLLIGPTTDPRDSSKLRSAKLWRQDNQELTELLVAAHGPLGFGNDGSPLQLVVAEGHGTLELTDLARGEVLRRFDIPGKLLGRSIPEVGMTPDASRVAAPVEMAGASPALVVWEGGSGKILHRFPGSTTCVAFSPDGSLVARSDGQGHITIRSDVTRREVASLPNGRAPVRCLAFGADPWRSPKMGHDNQASGWLLAVGDAGGTITVWDIGAGVPRSYCVGSKWDVYAVAFSPDGMTLASSGREAPKLWDVATGRLLLDLDWRGNFQFGLAFSPDGRRLAVGGLGVYGVGNVTVWELEPGRGIETLRGLRGQVPKAIFSPDGRLVAGLSQGWQVGIWDRKSGRLMHVLDAPIGTVADNSGLAFSPDSRRIALAAGRQATFWDLDTGAVRGSWALPEGLQDTLSFLGPGELMLLRVETTDGAPPSGDFRGGVHSRVCRLRNLLGQDPTAPVREIAGYDTHVFGVESSGGGRYFAIRGVGGPEQRLRIGLYDARSGGLLPWELTAPDWSPGSHEGWHQFDATGRVLAVRTIRQEKALTLVEVPSGRILRVVPCSSEPACVGPDAKTWFGGLLGPPSECPGSYLFRGDNGRRLAILEGMLSKSSIVSQFCRDGSAIVWGNADGTVTVCELEAVQRKLAGVGLGW